MLIRQQRDRCLQTDCERHALVNQPWQCKSLRRFRVSIVQRRSRPLTSRASCVRPFTGAARTLPQLRRQIVILVVGLNAGLVITQSNELASYVTLGRSATLPKGDHRRRRSGVVPPRFLGCLAGARTGRNVVDPISLHGFVSPKIYSDFHRRWAPCELLSELDLRSDFL